MRYMLLLLLLPLFTFCGDKEKEAPQTESQTDEPVTKTTYFLIRHAEKDQKDPKDNDPHLSVEGMMRAKRWASYFEDQKIDAIYISQYVRTKQTISLVAQQKDLAPISYRAHHLYSEDFLEKTKGKNILVVGHSNTIPQLANKLIGEEKYQDMDDFDHSTLFIVTLEGSKKTSETKSVDL